MNSSVHTTASGMQKIVPPGTMVIGADVGHPGPGIGNRPSMTSLVASLDMDCTKYAAFSSIQKPRVEKIEALEAMFKVMKSLRLIVGVLSVRVCSQRYTNSSARTRGDTPCASSSSGMVSPKGSMQRS